MPLSEEIMDEVHQYEAFIGEALEILNESPGIQLDFEPDRFELDHMNIVAEKFRAISKRIAAMKVNDSIQDCVNSIHAIIAELPANVRVHFEMDSDVVHMVQLKLAATQFNVIAGQLELIDLAWRRISQAIPEVGTLTEGAKALERLQRPTKRFPPAI